MTKCPTEEYTTYMFDDDEDESSSSEQISNESDDPDEKSVDKIQRHKMKTNKVCYEMTICPPPFTEKWKKAKACTLTNKQKFEEYYIDCLNAFIMELRPYVNYYEFYPELGHNGLLHFHGIIEFRDYITWLAFCTPQMCRYKINEFRPDYWPKYMIKDINQMEPWLKSQFRFKDSIIRIKFKAIEDKPIKD